MTGILSNSLLGRYQSGSGTDPMNQAGGMEGYLSQFNVNPNWMQYLQKGGGGLLNAYAQQSQPEAQGGLLNNPYSQGQNAYAAPATDAKKKSSGLTVMSGGQRMNPRRNEYSDMVLSDGRVISGSAIMEQIGKLDTEGSHEAFFGDSWADRSGNNWNFTKGKSVPDALLQLIGG